MIDLNKAYKHVFTSPSSVGKEPRATRSGNACIHDMTNVTRASIAYVVTQVSMLYINACSPDAPEGSLQPVFIASILEIRHCDRFGAVLHHHLGSP